MAHEPEDCKTCVKREMCEKGQKLSKEIFDITLKAAKGIVPMRREEVYGAVVIFNDRYGDWIHCMCGMAPDGSPSAYFANSLGNIGAIK